MLINTLHNNTDTAVKFQLVKYKKEEPSTISCTRGNSIVQIYTGRKKNSIPPHTLVLPVVDFIKLGIKGLRTGSSTLTGEEKSEHARPSELTGIDPPPRVHSLLERQQVTHS